MNLVYTGSSSAVEAVLEHGFEGNGDERVRLRRVNDGHAWVEADAAVILEAPDGALERFREAPSDGNDESFNVPPAELDGWRVVAHRGLADRHPEPGWRRHWPKIVATAGVFAAAAAATYAAGKDEDPPSRPASPPRASAAASAGPAPTPHRPAPAPPRRHDPPLSGSLGTPTDGRLVNGVRLPSGGEHFFTWDSTRRVSPNLRWRRFGSDRTVRIVLDVVAAFGRANPAAPRVGIADLSLPRGGDFGLNYGGSGHLSHQNGLDVDVLYPLRSGREVEGQSVAEIDRRLAQELLDRFVAAGAAAVYVGPGTGLSGPDDIVATRARHDTHMHIQLSER